MTRPIPRLSGVPLVGNVLELRRDPVAMLERLARECGEVGSFHLLGRRVVVTTSPDHARTILRDRARDFEKGPVVRRFARAILGEGLIPASNEAQRRHRRFLAPAFRPAQLEAYAASVPAAVADLVGTLGDGAEIDLSTEMMRLTLRIVGRALFSRDLLGEADALGAALTTALHWVTGMIQRPWAPAVPLRPAVRRAIAHLDLAIGAMIAARRALGREAGPPDLLQELVFAQDDEADEGEEGGGRSGAGPGRMSDRQVRDEVMNLMVAGYETTSNALTWTWHLLMRHPAAYERLRAEAEAAAGSGLPGSPDVPRLPFALACFEEAMRLFPPVHSLGRQAQATVDLEPYRLGRGSIVLVSTYLMHRRADLFPEPLAFRPERFLGPARDAVPPFAYLPFGAGPRVCIGARFASMEAVLILAGLAARVRFAALGAPPVPQMLVTLRPRHGLPCRVTRL